MHTHQFFTWTTHTAENTTLLDYKKLYTYMFNIVTGFYLYSIVYIYLINSRLDVTFSVRHHFCISNFIRRQPFRAGLNGQWWPCQPFRPGLIHSIQSQVADSDWAGHLSLGLNNQ